MSLDGLLNGEILNTILETGVVTEQRTKEYDTIGPHIALGYRPAAPGTHSQHQVVNA